MNPILDQLLAWLKSKNNSAHSVAAALLVIATIIVTDQKAQDLVFGIFKNHPSIGTWIIALAGIYWRYSHSSKPAAAGSTDPNQQ